MKTETIRLPEELFKQWLEDEVNKIENMDLLGIENRILELQQIIFEARTRMSKAHEKRIKLQGKDWADNSKSISDPSFRVDYEADRRKEKAPSAPKEKKDLQAAAGIDKDKLKAIIQAKMLEKKNAAIAAKKASEGEVKS
jgi:hypothetical protein